MHCGESSFFCYLLGLIIHYPEDRMDLEIVTNYATASSNFIVPQTQHKWPLCSLNLLLDKLFKYPKLMLLKLHGLPNIYPTASQGR